MNYDCDLAIIGAGPAGLAAACQASELGLKTTVFDEQRTPGGQIYRNVEHVAEQRIADLDILGEEYWQGYNLVREFRNSDADYKPDSLIWDIDTAGGLSIRADNGKNVYRVKAKHVLITTGAQERPVPIPGWTLPGVMSAGAAQTLLKSAGIVPDVPVIIAGSGPLLYLIAWQLLQAGVEIRSLLFTSRRFAAALKALPKALFNGSDQLRKGLLWERALRKAAIPMLDIGNLSAEGDGRLELIRFHSKGQERILAADLLLLHEGVVPNTQLTMLAGCEHRWDELQHCWRPVLDEWGSSSVATISIAGDGGGIMGAEAAIRQGRLSALQVAYQLGMIDGKKRNRLAYPERAWLKRQQKVRPFLDELFEPVAAQRIPQTEETIVCRCEEVTAGEVRAAARLGGSGPNQIKSFTRCGMGPCQGRMCGLTVSELIAAERGVSVAEVGHYRVRPPLKPLTIAELASLRGLDSEPGYLGGIAT